MENHNDKNLFKTMTAESMMMVKNETLAQELLNRLMDMVLSANATSGIGIGYNFPINYIDTKKNGLK